MKKILYKILLTLTIILSILIYSRFIGTTGLKTNEIPINTKSISNSYNGLKIVHFSDIHYKKVITNKRVKELIKEINKLKPDIVVFAGDLLDKDYNPTKEDIDFLIKELSQIKSTYGNFAIAGDSDYKYKDSLKNIYLQSNFTFLDNSSSIIYNTNNDKIFIGGLSSYKYKDANIDKTMEKDKDTNYKIIITHEPDYITEILAKYQNIDLILSAHSINGSINIPLIKRIFLPPGSKKYYKPYYKINNTDIYITNGIGVNNINFRLFNHPSINFYRIKRSN